MSDLRKAFSVVVLAALCLWATAAFGQAGAPGAAAPVKEMPASAIEAVTPADALIFVQAKNLTGIQEGFAKTALSQTIDKVELLSAGREIVKAGARFLVAYATDTPYDQVWKMVDKGFALILFAPKDQYEKPPGAIIIDVSGDKAGFEAMMNGKIIPRLKALDPNMKVESEDVQGVTLQKIMPGKKAGGCFALIGDAFVAGPEDAVKQMIGVSKGKTPSLASVAVYQAARQATTIDAGGFVYVNMDTVRAMSEQDADPEQKAKLDAVGLNGIQCIAASATFEGKGLREKLFIGTGKEKSGLLKHFADQPAKAPASVALVPQGFSVYAALQSGGRQKLYQALKELVRQMQGEEGVNRMQQVETAFQRDAQVDIEQDLFGAMGSEAFAAVDLRKVVEAAAAMRKPGFSDFEFIVGVEAEDGAKLEGSLAQIFLSPLFANQGVTINKVHHKNADMNVISDPRRPNMSVTYAFLDKFLVFANSTDTMKLVVDARESKKSLSASEDFAQLQTTMPKESNFMAYFDTKSVLPGLMSLASQRMPAPAKPFLPALNILAEQMTGMEVALVNAPDGIKGEAFSPIGGAFWGVTLASLGNLTKAPAERKIGQVMAAMGRTEWAIRAFRQATGRYPTTLGELVPQYMKKVPADPFSPDKMEIGYVLLAGGAAAPAAEAGAAPGAAKPAGTEMARGGAPVNPSEIAYLLLSVGPDGKKDIDPADANIAQLVKKGNSPDPADIAQLKAKVYQYKKEIFPEKRALNDTGDIVRPGK